MKKKINYLIMTGVLLGAGVMLSPAMASSGYDGTAIQPHHINFENIDIENFKTETEVLSVEYDVVDPIVQEQLQWHCPNGYEDCYNEEGHSYHTYGQHNEYYEQSSTHHEESSHNYGNGHHYRHGGNHH